MRIIATADNWSDNMIRVKSLKDKENEWLEVFKETYSIKDHDWNKLVTILTREFREKINDKPIYRNTKNLED